ncbi:MAG TPA: ATP-binding protein [Mycobacteriales bacterium]|nr:ATP-binding protein [Mycobacteriales bacterium]
MAPAVPFALLGAVQLSAVAVWLGVAVAACFPRLRRPTTPLIVVGAAAVAAADVLTTLHLDVGQSDALAWLRFAGLALVLLGPLLSRLRISAAAPAGLPAIIAPLGARPTPAILGGVAGLAAAALTALRARRPGADRQVAIAFGVGLFFTGVSAALADPARTALPAALALLASRAAGSLGLIIGLALLARANLLGKLVGAIVAGVVAMAIGAVAVVGLGVTSEIQHDQSNRLQSVGRAEVNALRSVETRASLLARTVTACPTVRELPTCVRLPEELTSDPDVFIAIGLPSRGGAVRLAVPPLYSATLDQRARAELKQSLVVQSQLLHVGEAADDEMVLGAVDRRLAVVAAAGGPATADASARPKYVSIYGIWLGDAYLRQLGGQVGYGVSVIADGKVVNSSLGAVGRAQVETAFRSVRDQLAQPDSTPVVPAQGHAPTVAFVPVDSSSNGDVRVATLAVSQPAGPALAGQRNVLRRLVITALAVLLVVALLSFALSQRIAEPVRRLTVAARRVRSGDLNTAVALPGRDEVGSLSRAFDAMTSSLRGLTDDLRQAAAQEAALRARLETVVESLTDGLLTTDAADIVTSANPMALSLLARDLDDVLGRKLTEALDVRAPDGSQLLDGGSTVRLGADAVLRRTDGQEVPVRVAVAPLTDEPGRVVVVSDRTREREVERLKTEFLSNVSHELRSPLTPIRGYAEMLARRPELPPQQIREFVGEILAGTARMNRAVELLMDVAALEAGRVSPRRRVVTASSLVSGRLAAWKARYPDRTKDFRRRVAAGLPAIDVDPDWLAKALDELADNAVKYTAAGTPITLTATSMDGSVRLAVRDAGAGIDTSRLGELLGDFSQADASETRHVGGMGLGLGFVTRVVAQLGVSLHVESTPGQGSEFAVDVPAAMPARPRRAAGKRQPGARRR